MMRHCKHCGVAARGFLTLDVGGNETAHSICEGCRSSLLTEFHGLCADFDAMIAAGVDRVMANRIMIARLEPSS